MKTVTKQQPYIIFRKVFNGQANFMTPDVIGYHVKQNGTRVVETSKGEGIERGSVIYGVTVLDYIDGQWKHIYNLCQCHHTPDDVENYIATL